MAKEEAKAEKEEAKAKEEANEDAKKKAAAAEAVRQSFQAVHGMAKNPNKIWANVVIQVLLHVPTFYDYVGAHTCSKGNTCPAGILRSLRLFSELEDNEEGWGNEQVNQVFDKLDDNNPAQDASEALTRLFSAIKRCEQDGNSAAEVPLDRLLGIRSKITITDGTGHVSVTPVIVNHLITNVPKSTTISYIRDLLEKSIAPVEISDYDCRLCSTKVAAKQTTEYFPPAPPVILVTLTRMEDKNACVHFEQPVNLPGSTLQYNLTGVICYNHTRDQYWVVVKKMGAGGMQTWIKAEDTKVRSITMKTLQSYGKVAQILVYEHAEDPESDDGPEAMESDAKAEEAPHTSHTYVCSNLRMYATRRSE